MNRYPVDLTLVRNALREDMPYGDASLAYIDGQANATADFVARSQGKVCGLDYAEATLREYGAQLGLHEVSIQKKCEDGSNIAVGDTIASIQGPIGWVVGAERTALNFLQRLSGLCTHANRILTSFPAGYVVCDTRKTTPGWRMAEKNAFRCAGLANHRLGLSESVMLKDSHRPYWRPNVEQQGPLSALEIEIDSLDQLDEAVALQPTTIMLDNFSGQDLVAATREIPSGIRIEWSGMVSPGDAPALPANTLVYVSIGSGLQQFGWLDIGLDLDRD